MRVGDSAMEIIRKLSPGKPHRVSPVPGSGCFTATRGSRYLRSYSWALHRHHSGALKLALLVWLEGGFRHKDWERLSSELPKVGRTDMFSSICFRLT